MKIALVGYGKMGKAIESVAIAKNDEIVLRISSGNVDELTRENLEKADVAIEFSRPETAFKNIMDCLDFHIPVVCGTTGWLQHLPEVEKKVKASNGSFLYASNFSIGVNIFFALNTYLADIMKDRKDYDVAIEETHHIHKKDAPSGTAISLADAIIKTGKKDHYIDAQSSSPEDLTIISNRTGEIPGTHLVNYFSANDKIEIIHTAKNRMGFAEGALAAASFIRNRKGIFTMKDVIGIG